MPRPRHRMQFCSRVIFTGLLNVLVAARLPGQSLADVARRAEEAHEANRNNQTRVLTDADIERYKVAGNIDVLNLDLTMQDVRRYAAARTAVYRTMSRDLPLAQRINTGLAGSRYTGDFERAYGSEPAVLASIQASGMVLHQYVVTELAFGMALVAFTNRLPPELAGRGTIASNTELVRRNEQEINGLFRESVMLEQQMAPRVAPNPKP